jgi:hypothetical protein
MGFCELSIGRIMRRRGFARQPSKLILDLAELGRVMPAIPARHRRIDYSSGGHTP